MRCRHRGTAVADRQLLERQRKEFAMLMRFEPFREFDRVTEELLAAGRVRRSASTPTAGAMSSRFISTCPAWIRARSS